MKTGTWAVLAVLGLGLMVLSYDKLVRGDPQAPWAFGFLCIGDGEAAKPLDVGTLVSTRLRLLPAASTGGSSAEGRQCGHTAEQVEP